MKFLVIASCNSNHDNVHSFSYAFYANGKRKVEAEIKERMCCENYTYSFRILNAKTCEVYGYAGASCYDDESVSIYWTKVCPCCGDREFLQYEYYIYLRRTKEAIRIVEKEGLCDTCMKLKYDPIYKIPDAEWVKQDTLRQKQMFRDFMLTVVNDNFGSTEDFYWLMDTPDGWDFCSRLGDIPLVYKHACNVTPMREILKPFVLEIFGE